VSAHAGGTSRTATVDEPMTSRPSRLPQATTDAEDAPAGVSVASEPVDEPGTVQTEVTGAPNPFRTRVVPGIALVLVLGLLGLLAYSLFAPESARLQEGTATGRDAPDFAVTTFDGTPFKLSEQRGKIVIVNFWASWCPPCQEETPLLTTAAGQLDPDVILIGVAAWDARGDAEAFAAGYRINYPVAMDSGSVALDFGLVGVPETFVVDADGKIVSRLPGPVTSLQQLRDMVAAAR
jgi:cytochrome c biogenesis protein CcmG, thiol:disulfide interchange protein DsbE